MRIAFFLILLIYSTVSSAQDTLWSLANVVNFQIDPLGQLVYQDAQGRLLRQDIAADTTFVFYDNRLGDPSTVDISNPFGPLVHFKDFALILLLDRTLNEVNRLDYRSSNLIGTGKAVARNFDDHIWLYDIGDFRLKLLDLNGQTIRESDDLRSLLGLYDEPEQLLVSGNKIYAYFPGQGLAVFTNFGQFIRWEQEGLDVNQLILYSGKGIGWTESLIYYLLPSVGSIQTYPLPNWAAFLGDNDVILKHEAGWVILSNKSLFYLK